MTKADVVVENYRPDVKYRLGVDYESLSQVNPRLVYGSISGFGEDGPYQDRPGFDQIAQGMGGLMSITGIPGQGPVRAGIPLLTCVLACSVPWAFSQPFWSGIWEGAVGEDLAAASADFYAGFPGHALAHGA